MMNQMEGNQMMYPNDANPMMNQNMIQIDQNPLMNQMNSMNLQENENNFMMNNSNNKNNMMEIGQNNSKMNINMNQMNNDMNMNHKMMMNNMNLSNNIVTIIFKYANTKDRQKINKIVKVKCYKTERIQDIIRKFRILNYDYNDIYIFVCGGRDITKSTLTVGEERIDEDFIMVFNK